MNEPIKQFFKITGQRPQFFHPPFEAINKRMERNIAAYGQIVMKMGIPDINTWDYVDFSKHGPPEILVTRIKTIINRREEWQFYQHVLLFHELSVTVEALGILIPYFKNQGYQFIRLDDYWMRIAANKQTNNLQTEVYFISIRTLGNPSGYS